MPIAVVALAIGMFAIGTAEFVVVGLLLDIAADLGVSISTAGLLVTAYAAATAVGGPVLIGLTGRAERKRLLMACTVLFVIGNVMAALAPGFGILLAARLITSLAAAGVASVAVAMAVQLVDERRRARAIAAVFGGLTIALVIGVPLGSFLGTAFGWRVPFLAVAVLGIASLMIDAIFLPAVDAATPMSFVEQLTQILRPPLMTALVIIVLGFGGQILAYTYIAPLLETVTGFPRDSVSLLLLIFGVAAAIGTFAAGPIGDRFPRSAPAAGLAILAAALCIAGLFERQPGAMVVALLVWGAAGFGIGPILQRLASDAAPQIPQIASSLAISAFNAGVAGGALAGGWVVDGIGVAAVPWVGAGVAAVAVIVAVCFRFAPPRVPRTNAPMTSPSGGGTLTKG